MGGSWGLKGEPGWCLSRRPGQCTKGADNPTALYGMTDGAGHCKFELVWSERKLSTCG